MENITLPVKGMSCGGCVNSVTRVLSALNGVQHVEVQLDNACAKISFDSSKVGPEQLKAAVRDAGFETS